MASMLYSAHCPFKPPKFIHTLIIFLTITISITQNVMGSCFTSIFGFGDSYTDTGNGLYYHRPPCAVPPYGETYFHYSTGRCSNGRLIIDFIAEYLELPLVVPYLGGKDYRSGANFAVGGATVLSDAFWLARGIHVDRENASLGVQLGWFKEFLQSHCKTSTNCNELLKSSLVLVGEIGGNDYNHPLFSGRSVEEVQSFVPLVVNAIASTISELIKLGAVTLMVPGNLPTGCLTILLDHFRTSDKKKYDPTSGCLIWLNKLSEHHNEMLQIELNRIQKLHPRVKIIYADYYNAAMRLYRSPTKFGFTRGALRACCGAGGPYNYNSSAYCGNPPSTACDDPSLYASWDGWHLTEAAYKWIMQDILEGPYTTPRFDSQCIAKAVSGESFIE